MWPLAIITFLEGVRHRVLYGIILLAVFIMAQSIVFVRFFMQDIGKIAVDFSLSAISFAGLLIAISLSVNLLAQDIEKKTIYFVLSKPISRTGYIVGKFVGISLLTLLAYLVLTLLSSLTILIIKNQLEQYFSMFSWSAFLQGVYFDFLKISLFNSVILFFSTFASSSFLTLLFSICTYIAGQSISEVINFLSITQPGIIVGNETIPTFIHSVKYIVPNFSFFDFKVSAAHGILANWQDFFFCTGYGVSYSAMLLCFAAFIFSRKELL